MAQTVVVESPIRTLGSVEGWIEPEPSRFEGRFILRERIWHGEVVCTVDPDRADPMDGKWGHRAYVFGLITREEESGRPLRIDDVSEIELLPEVEPGSLLRAARGIAPAPPGAEPPEVFIRRWRDEE